MALGFGESLGVESLLSIDSDLERSASIVAAVIGSGAVSFEVTDSEKENFLFVVDSASFSACAMLAANVSGFATSTSFVSL